MKKLTYPLIALLMAALVPVPSPAQQDNDKKPAAADAAPAAQAANAAVTTVLPTPVPVPVTISRMTSPSAPADRGGDSSGPQVRQVSDGLVPASTAAATPMQIRAMSSSEQIYGGIVYTRSRKGRSHTPFPTAAAVARAMSTERSS